MAWESWNLKDSSAIQSLEAIGSAIAPVVDTIESVLSIVKSVLEFAAALIVDIPDLQTAAIQAAIETVRAILKDLTDDAGCYFLPIPVHLKNVVAEEDLLFDPTPGGPEASTTATVFLPPVGGGGGGNYGFLKDLIDSLNDGNDILRPQFDSDAHIAGLVVVAGADSYLDILPLVEKLKRLFSGEKKSGAGEGIGSTDGATIPKTTSLKAEIVPSAVGSKAKLLNRLEGGEVTHPYAVKLSWALPERITVIRKSPYRYTFTVKKVVVFRADHKLSIYASPAGLQDYKIKEFEFDGLTATFYDDTIEVGRPYYYAVGYENEATAEVLNVDDQYVLQNRVTYTAAADAVTDISVPVDVNTMPRSGVPPDWVLLPSPIALIPGILEIVNSVNAFLDTLEERLDTGSSNIQRYIDAISQEIERYSSTAQSVINTINSIIDLLEFPDVYIGVYPFADKGGNTKLINIVGTALNDTNDANRPPFDSGDEVLTGFVLYAGSATAGKLEAFVSLIETLVGQAAGSAASAYAEAAADIGIAVDEIQRQVCFLENLESTVCTVEEEETPSGLGPDLEPSEEENESAGCAS